MPDVIDVKQKVQYNKRVGKTTKGHSACDAMPLLYPPLLWSDESMPSVSHSADFAIYGQSAPSPVTTFSSSRQLTAGSLFSGVGMFDLAFTLAGFDILFQIEIDPYCQKVLAKHAPTYWPNSTVHADVRHVGRDTLPAVDVLFGGFPCTDLSMAGKGAGIQHGAASGLWYEFKRIIGELRPRAVMLENVAAILRRDGHIVVSDLAALGYDCQWGVISAADAGAPHLRERWWCVALSNTENARIDRGNGQQGNHAAGSGERAVNRGVRGDDGDAVGVSDSQYCQNVYAAALKNSARGTGINQGFSASWTSSEGYESQSRLGGSADGSPARMDGHRLMSHVFPVGPHLPQPDSEAPRMAPGNKNTNARLKALGNGGLPQIVYPIACELRDLLTGEEA